MEDAGGKSEQPVRDADGPNFERLAALKKRFDPPNFLTGNRISSRRNEFRDSVPRWFAAETSRYDRVYNA
jgi:hypothetical protein